MSFPREFNFNKLLFGGFLDEEVINKLDKIQGFRMGKRRLTNICVCR